MGGVAAPIAGQILSEILPYMEIKKENEETEKKNVEMPDVTGINIKDAEKILKELNLEVEIDGEETPESQIVNQLPKKGIQIKEGTRVTLYVN